MKKTLIVATLSVLGLGFPGCFMAARPARANNSGTRLAGLEAPTRVIRDSDGIPHIFAANDRDATFLLGYSHAQDRFFQMDFLRHTFSGTLTELAGRSALEQDLANRTLGVRRAAEESFSACSPEGQSLLQAYADGVNAFLAEPGNPLPPEYAALRLTKAGVPPWTPVDSLAILKGFAFQLSFWAEDEIRATVALAAFQQAGAARGFDGNLLFFEDVFRTAPFEPTLSAPGFLPAAATPKPDQARRARGAIDSVQNVVRPEALRLAGQYLRATQSPLPFQNLLSPQTRPFSNWWIVSGKHTDSGFPMMAADPHMSLFAPAMFYEAHLAVSNDPKSGPMNVNGVSFAGTPAIIMGCNEKICWGTTTNPMDVTDVYQEELALDAAGRPHATLFRGVSEPLVAIPQSYRVNRIQTGSLDSFVDSGITPSQPGGTTYIVPRRNNGPLLQVDAANRVALSVQYTGFRATRELDALWLWARARNLDEFKAGLQFYDVGSMNWGYADTEGNIAFFSSAEMPLREDLERLGHADGAPPYLIRDGTGRFRNEWLPVERRQPGQALEFEILPAAEMPQAVNPAQGFLLSSNNDPVGTSFDNNPLNTFRPGGGVYYLWGLGYHEGPCRAARVERLIKSGLADGGKISLNDMKRFQANSQMFDAEVLTPHILTAFRSAHADDAPDALKSLAADPRVAEAVGRLASWDFSAPTGIREGYDPGDDPDNLPEPSEDEIRNSVAATIYSVWRGRILAGALDATLTRLGLGSCQGCGPNSRQAMAALRNLLDSFPTGRGRGASGVNFFEVDGAPTPEAARDILILRGLQRALDLLAGDQFAAAYGRSTNQNDYRWGKLHRVTFQHPLGNPGTIPTAGGYSHLTPALPGIARAGGWEVVDAANHAGSPGSPQDGTFQDGAARRFVGELTPAGIRGSQIIAGGQSGVPGSPHYAGMLGRWLTNRYHTMLLTPSEVEAGAAVDERFEP